MLKKLLLILLLITFVTALPPDDVWIISGTEVQGGVVNVTNLDSLFNNYTENSGLNALEVRWNFSGIDSQDNLFQSCITYDGTHDVFIQVWNLSSTSWFSLQELTGGGAEDCYNESLNSSSIVVNEMMLFRVDHPDNGIPTEDLLIKYLNNTVLGGTPINGGDSYWVFTSFEDENYMVRVCTQLDECINYNPNTPIPINSTKDYVIQLIPRRLNPQTLVFDEFPLVYLSIAYIILTLVFIILLYFVIIFLIDRGLIQ